MTDLPPFVKTIKRTRSIGIDLGTLTLSESVNLYDALINKAAREREGIYMEVSCKNGEGI